MVNGQEPTLSCAMSMVIRNELMTHFRNVKANSPNLKNIVTNKTSMVAVNIIVTKYLFHNPLKY